MFFALGGMGAAFALTAFPIEPAIVAALCLVPAFAEMAGG